MNTKRLNAINFFREHAQDTGMGRLVTAGMLADAESLGNFLGIQVKFTADPNYEMPEGLDADTVAALEAGFAYVAKGIARDPETRRELASLQGLVFYPNHATDPNTRVAEAVLMAEALQSHDESESYLVAV